MDKKKKILALVAIVLVGGLAALSATGGISGLRSSYIYDGDGNIIGGDAMDDTSTVGSTGDTWIVEDSSVQPEPVNDENIFDGKNAEELEDIIKEISSEISDLDGVISTIESRVSGYDNCTTGINPELDKLLSEISTKSNEIETAKNNLESYKKDPKNGTLVGKVRVSITEQEAEKGIIISNLKSGSPVTGNSTESVNNASIVANNKLINDAKTGLNKKLADAKKAKNIPLQKSIQAQIDAINGENKNITRINTLNKQLTAAYKVKAYVELKKVIDTKTAEYTKLTGVDNSIINGLLAQKAKRDSIIQCQVDFTDWWKQYKSDHFDKAFNFISVNLIPKAYAQTNKDPAKAKAEAEKAKAEAEKAKQKLKDKGNKAKEKLGKALSALGKLAEAVPQLAVGICANLAEQVWERAGNVIDSVCSWDYIRPEAVCGNSKVEAENNEECEPGVTPSKDTDDGHYTCDYDCKWHKSI